MMGENNPFTDRKQQYPKSNAAAGDGEEHFRMLRLGNDMIDNLFRQMHDLIDKAKAQLKDQFKDQLIGAFQSKFERQTQAVSEHVNKLESNLCSWIPRMEQLRNEGHH